MCSITQLHLAHYDPMGYSLPTPLSIECSRQEYWSRLPFSTSRDLPNPRIKPASPASSALTDFLPLEPPGKSIIVELHACMLLFQSCLTLCDPMNRSTLGLPSITNSRSSLKLMSIESVMPSSHLVLCRPLLLLPPIPPSIRVFPNESTLHMRWPKYWSLSFNISPSNEHQGLISFRMDWLDLLAVQGTLKCLLQHHC